jgi:hypothetical protein
VEHAEQPEGAGAGQRQGHGTRGGAGRGVGGAAALGACVAGPAEMQNSRCGAEHRERGAYGGRAALVHRGGARVRYFARLRAAGAKAYGAGPEGAPQAASSRTRARGATHVEENT